MNWIKRIFIWKDTIGIRETVFDKLLQIGQRVTCVESNNRSLESRIKLLEDNAFSDRAKRIELENKVEAQVKDYERRIELLQGNASLNTSHIMRLEDEVEELTNKIIRLECK